MTETRECCTQFDPQPWDKVTHDWKDKPFMTETIPQFLHMPLPWIFKRTLLRMWKKAEALGIATDIKDFLLLAYDPLAVEICALPCRRSRSECRGRGKADWVIH